MAEPRKLRTSLPDKDKKKKWTKKRIRRYARAWFFRILCVLIVLLALLLVVTGVRALAKGIGGLVSGMGSAKTSAVTAETEENTADAAEETVPESAAEPETEAVTEAATEAVTETSTEAPAAEVKTLTLTATGDCTLGTSQTQTYDGSFTEYYDENGPDYFFGNVKDLFSADDLTLVNLECVLTESTERENKQSNLKGRPEYTKILSGSSVEAVSLGNNHTADYGAQSLTDTETNLDKAGVKWAIDSDLGYCTTEDGLTVGIVSKEVISMSDEKEQEMLDGIAELKKNGADLIVACCHWGNENKSEVYDKQIHLAHDLIDAGADLVIGNHPQVLSGMEVYKGKVICYSLGNFCFGGSTDPDDCDTMIYQQTFTFEDGTVTTDLDAKIIPCRISSDDSCNDYQPRIVSGDEKQTIIDDVSRYSAKLGDVTIDSEGNIMSASSAEEITADDSTSDTTEDGDASENNSSLSAEDEGNSAA